MGRAGAWFTITDEGVTPDIVLSAKSLGGGMPISAVTGRADLMDAVHIGGLGGTYGGNPVAAAAALAVLDVIERDDLLASSRRVGETVMARFRSLQDRFPQVGEVRGRGAMCAIELVADPATKEPLDAARMGAITSRALAEGVIVITAGNLRQRRAAAAADQHRRGVARRRTRRARRVGRRRALLAVRCIDAA